MSVLRESCSGHNLIAERVQNHKKTLTFLERFQVIYGLMGNLYLIKHAFCLAKNNQGQKYFSV